jgi:hypothetical protein
MMKRGSPYLIMAIEVFLEPIENIIAREVSKDTLVEVRATASAEVVYVMDVHRNLPDARERFRRTRINFALVGDPEVERVGPDGSIGDRRADRAVPD